MMAVHRVSRRVPRSATNYVCCKCLLIRRFSTQRAGPPSASFTALPSRRLIAVHGPDATKFLQGMITSNIKSTTAISNGGFYTVFLSSKGRILNDVFIYRDFPDSTQPADLGGDAWIIEVDVDEAEQLTRHIRKFKLMAKFQLRILDVGERTVWATWKDEEGAWTKHKMGRENSVIAEEFGKDTLGCSDLRAPGMGTRLLLPGETVPEGVFEGLTETTPGMYKLRRYLKGVPEGPDELLRDKALPQESNIDYMGGLDYGKGCYVGQELTIRTHHTGVIRKRILPLMVYDPDAPEPETLEYLPGRGIQSEQIPTESGIGRLAKRSDTAGKWLAGFGNVGLGLCRLEIMTDTVMQADVRSHMKDRFLLRWDSQAGEPQAMRAKAFVPSWHPSNYANQ